jgi:nucleoside-diphosphate-sugar epimerase
MGCNSSSRASEPGGKGLVTITGISGYIGAHVALTYLEDGGFKVRGTVRNKDDPAKLE